LQLIGSPYRSAPPYALRHEGHVKRWGIFCGLRMSDEIGSRTALQVSAPFDLMKRINSTMIVPLHLQKYF
jgi:hypothetical protein